MEPRQVAETEAVRLEIHRNEKAINDGLASARVVLVEDPIVSVLAWQRNPGRYSTRVAVDHIKIIGDAMDLFRSKMVNVLRPATGFFDPLGDGPSVTPNVVSFALPTIQNEPKTSQSA